MFPPSNTCFSRPLIGLVVYLFATAAPAVPVQEIPIGDGFLDVEYITGDGEFTSYLIVDFDSTDGPSFAFGYRWDEPVDSFTMLEAIDEAGPLDVAATPFVFGEEVSYFVDNFSYTDAEQTTHVGDAEKFWRFDIGIHDGLGVNWATSLSGASDRMILPDSFDGWYNLNLLPPPVVETRVVVPTVPIVGDGADFDLDGDVDGDDFLLWQAGFGRDNAKFKDGDANGDGVVNGDDFLIWQAGYGTPLDKEIASLPEPLASVLFAVASAAAAAIRPRRPRPGPSPAVPLAGHRG